MEEIRTCVVRELKERKCFKLWHLLRAGDGSLRLATTAFFMFLAQQSACGTAFT
jgi:hypothetical protein